VVAPRAIGTIGSGPLCDDSDVLEFRRSDAAQAPAADLLEAMIAELTPLYGRIDVPHAPSATPADFAPPAGSFLVGWDGDQPICCGGVKGLPPQPGEEAVRACEIKRMYVVPAARGRGVARALLVALEDEARALGYHEAKLDTGPHQPHAERMYRAAGYADTENFNANPFASYWGRKRL
jgi:GNAT superfamily N-acetyltransferase